MRRSLIRLGALSLSALSLGAVVHACGFSAGIIVNQIQYDHTEFVTTSQCGSDNNTVDLVYILIDSQLHLMPDTSPLFGLDGVSAVKVEIPDALKIDGQTATLKATVGDTKFVQVTRSDRARAIALMMDNSRSFDGYNEETGAREPLTDPNNRRISGAQDFIGNINAIFPSIDRGTLVAFHGDGTSGVFPKMAAMDGETPRPSWFVASTDFFKQKLQELRTEVSGKTPFFDAIDVGVEALSTVSVQRVMVGFIDGPDNSSQASQQEAQDALNNARVPFLGIGLKPKLLAGEASLRSLACGTTPQGAVAVADSANELGTKFVQMSYLVTGYWKTTLTLERQGSLPSGTYKVTGRLYADPVRAPKACDETVSQPCGDKMQCDNREGPNQGRCYAPITFYYSTN